jgi:cation/acetate symporter
VTSELGHLAAGDGSFPVFPIFATFVSCALFLALWVTTDDLSPGDFYVSDGLLKARRNGIALFGDYMSAATLLGTPGMIALTGYDGIAAFLLAPIVGWIVILLLVAEPYHSTGRFTVGDCLARRLNPRPVHAAAGLATLVICMLYLVAQLVGAGALAAPILGFSSTGAQKGLVAALGFLMILYVVIGGMRATTIVQLVKAVLILGGGVTLAALVMFQVGWNPGELLHRAAASSGFGDQYLGPGLNSGSDATSQIDFISLQLAALLGVAGLPHLLMRLGAVPTARAARQSVQWAASLTLVFCLTAGVLGLGAAALVGPDAIRMGNRSGNTATLLLSEYLGGPLLLTLICCIAFMTILAVVAGVVLAAATSLAHDLYQSVIRKGQAPKKHETLVARSAVVLVGTAATALSMYAQNMNIATLVGLPFAVAASAILPALLYNLYWRGFTTRGATWAIYGGLTASVVLVIFSPAVSGGPTALLPDRDFAFFPLRNPAVVSIPVGYLLGWLGSALDSRGPDVPRFIEVERRIAADARN